MLLWLLRGSFAAIIIGMATFALLYFQQEKSGFDPHLSFAAFAIILLVGIVSLVGDMVIRNKQITTISAICFGLLLGLVLGALFSMALEPFLSYSDRPQIKLLAQPLRLLITLVCCYISTSTLLQTKD